MSGETSFFSQSSINIEPSILNSSTVNNIDLVTPKKRKAGTRQSKSKTNSGLEQGRNDVNGDSSAGKSKIQKNNKANKLQTASDENVEKDASSAVVTPERHTIKDVLKNVRSGVLAPSFVANKIRNAELRAIEKSKIVDVSLLPIVTAEATVTAVEEENRFLSNSDSPQAQPFAPQVQIIDGKIVVDASSLQITAPSVRTGPFEKVTETSSKVTSASFSNHSVVKRWTKEENDLFYKGISYFGLSPEMISQLFPSRTAKQLVSKLTKETKDNPDRIEYALQNRIRVNKEEFKQKVLETQAILRTERNLKSNV